MFLTPEPVNDATLRTPQLPRTTAAVAEASRSNNKTYVQIRVFEDGLTQDIDSGPLMIEIMRRSVNHHLEW